MNNTVCCGNGIVRSIEKYQYSAGVIYERLTLTYVFSVAVALDEPRNITGVRAWVSELQAAYGRESESVLVCVLGLWE